MCAVRQLVAVCGSSLAQEAQLVDQDRASWQSDRVALENSEVAAVVPVGGDTLYLH